MSPADRPHSNTSSTPQLVDAWHARRRPRPPGSSWLLDPDLDLATLRYNDIQQRGRLISLASRPADAPTRSRRAFTNEKRKAVCLMAARTKMTHQELADLFNTNKKTISNTLKHSDVWMHLDLTNKAKLARKRHPVHMLMEISIHSWAVGCTKNDVLITDDNMKSKAMELAEELQLLDLPRPFVCSSKWLRNVRSRLGIVDGKLLHYVQTSVQRRDEPDGSSTSESHSTLSEPSEPSPKAFSPQPSAELLLGAKPATFSSSDSSTSPMTFESTIVGPHADTDIPPSGIPPAFALSTTEGPIGSLPIWVRDAPPLSMMEQPTTSHHTPSPQSSPELYTPGWLDVPELADPVGRYEKYDGICDAPASNLQSELGRVFPTDMSTSFLLTDEHTGGPPASSSMQASCPPLLADVYPGPALFAPLDFMAHTDRVPTMSAPFDSPFPDPPVPSSFVWPTNTSPTFTSLVDVSAPSMPPTDSLDMFGLQPACVPQEDIDRLAAEMMRWPIEALLDDLGVSMSQSHATQHCGEMSFDAPMLCNWPCTSLDGLGNTGFVPA